MVSEEYALEIGLRDMVALLSELMRHIYKPLGLSDVENSVWNMLITPKWAID